MIRSCDDVKTVADFHEFRRHWSRMYSMGLHETAKMLRWNERYLVCPKLLSTLQEVAYD